MEIRHPPKGGVLPIPLEFQSFDPDWVWIMGNAVLIGAGAHDLVILLRIIRYGEMPPTWIHRMLRHVIKECRERGYRRFMIFFSDDIDEQKLRNIAHRFYGAHFEPFTGDVVVGEI